jgi:hypothetical protein
MLKIPDSLPQPLPCFTVPFDENRFVDWLVDADPGDTIAYYRGHLAHDRLPSRRVIREKDRRKLTDLADRIMVASDQGLLMPVQRRVGAQEWIYLAIRTSDVLRISARSHASGRQGWRGCNA